MKNSGEHKTLTVRGQRYEELDSLAFEIGPTMDEKKLSSLPFEEQTYVLSMAHLYMLHKMGLVTLSVAQSIKKRNIKRCERIRKGMLYARYLKQKELICTKGLYKEYTELVRLLKEKSSKALNKALEIIDSISGMYVLSKIYTSEAESPGRMIADIEDVFDEQSADKAQRFIEDLMKELQSEEMDEFFSVLDDKDVEFLINRLPERDRFFTADNEELREKI